jgi:hypothetical protein
MSKLFKVTVLALAAYFMLTAESCSEQPTAVQQEAQRQEAVQAESNQAVGTPNITHFTEKRIFKEIYEKRDEPNLATFTYLVGMHNEHTALCRSIGYGIPESMQYTNPSLIGYASSQVGVATLPQADPNALYSSPTALGTWILCLFKDKTVQPVRSEPNVITLPEAWDQLNQDGM